MNILKILGIVVAVHVVAFFLMFVNPGCRSTTPRPTAEAGPSGDTGTSGPAAMTPAPEMGAPGVSVDTAPPPVVRYSPTRPGTPAAAALETESPGGVTPVSTYTVVAGDSLWKVARKHGTTVAELLHANRLTSNSRLTVGQKLIIPGHASGPAAGAASAAGAPGYTVKPGDTLSTIARRAGTTSAELMRINKLRSNYVRVGQELILPAGAPTDAAPAAAPAAAASAAPIKKADGSVIHVVKPGETLGAIARKYQVKVADLAVANNIADPKKIRAGQELVIPGFTAVGGSQNPSASAAPAANPPPANAPATPPAANPPDNSGTPASPPPDQDLDSGLKPQGEVPVIKVDGDETKQNP